MNQSNLKTAQSDSGPNFKVSNKALEQIDRLIQSKKNPNLKLRVYIQGGGCSGFQYGFTLDEQALENDHVLEYSFTEIKKIIVLCDMMSMQYLESAILDYLTQPSGSRFIITNPNAQTTCSCGSSFAIKE